MSKISKNIFTKSYFIFSLILFLLWIKLPEKTAEASLESDVMGNWADKFGEELWDLAQKMTKADEIKAKYKVYNARVEQKDGDSLIQSIVENAGRMLTRKMDAIKCIINEAEEAAEQFEMNETIASTFQYYSSKYSAIQGQDPPDIPESIQRNYSMYLNMSLNPDTHFFDISVNTDYSAVHVPQNVYDGYTNVMEALQWSERLDQVFIQNYNSDPALSWQYFGSYTGILRHYPALEWQRSTTDTYDCRKRSWYIETATCSKDIVILLDNSGSMTGYRNYIAQLTIKSILDTFSNNDFINIYKYSNDVDPVIPCFKDMLIQATPENMAYFNEAVRELHPEGYADVKKAYVKAFELLEDYRIKRRCNETSSGCNQAIMLVTDGVAGNATDVFEAYNLFENGTKIPVRVFTYLLGREVTKVREIQWMACLNRGFYSHIVSLDQVQEEVLQYVSVIAGPLVLQGVEHPPTWTHAFTDTASNQYDIPNDDKPPRLMIAVGAPAFDRKTTKNNRTRTAQILGVAGTDIPVDDLDELTLPYKLGVNGYSFIVSNNGYVLLHPDLRPVSKGFLKENYNSIDLSEIEQFDHEFLYETENATGREEHETLLELRENLVFSRTGKMEKVPVRFHYDKMRRVSLEYQDYYYAPLEFTPFSLGLVLPRDYGMTWIKVGDEVKRNQHMGVNISDFFVGENWKVHPEWVYCKYHYLEGHEFQTPEDELKHFLIKMAKPDWKWSQQYEPDIEENKEGELNCGRKTLDDDAYYCNKELVQLLIFDAKVTNQSYRNWIFESSEEKNLIEMYNATLRFVASMSGLTRWQFIFGEIEVAEDKEFGDYHTKAVDETWYKSAVLQHKIDAQSFVYSVPHWKDEPEDEEIKVTSTMAIFPRDGGLEAPGCVTGFQFSHSKLWDRFMEITSKINCDDCVKTCDSDDQQCYVIDNNGYVVLSENMNDTGRFFGEIQGEVMLEMVNIDVFKMVKVFDLQGLCEETIAADGAANILINPIKAILMAINWLVTEFFFHLSRLEMWAHGLPTDEINEDYDYEDHVPIIPPQPKKPAIDDDEEYWNRPKEIKYDTKRYACDMISELYVLNQELFIQGNGYVSIPDMYFAKRIKRSNLLLVVVNALYISDNSTILTSSPQKVVHNSTEEEDYGALPCVKKKLNYLKRRRIEECFTEHPDEAELTYCGRANLGTIHLGVMISSILTLLLIHCAIFLRRH